MAHDPEAADLARRVSYASQSGAAADELGALMREVDALFAGHQDKVYAYCLRFVGRKELAMDLAQDTLLRAYEKFPTFRGEARFSTWLLKIARYNCLNAIRKRRDTLTEDGLVVATDPKASTLTQLRRREREELLREAAVAVLDPVEQEAVWLRYVEHASIEQITATLDIQQKSGARGILQRCKRKLQREIRRRLDELGHGTSFVRGTLE